MMNITKMDSVILNKCHSECVRHNNEINNGQIYDLMSFARSIERLEMLHDLAKDLGYSFRWWYQEDDFGECSTIQGYKLLRLRDNGNHIVLY